MAYNCRETSFGTLRYPVDLPLAAALHVLLKNHCQRALPRFNRMVHDKQRFRAIAGEIDNANCPQDDDRWNAYCVNLKRFADRAPPSLVQRVTFDEHATSRPSDEPATNHALVAWAQVAMAVDGTNSYSRSRKLLAAFNKTAEETGVALPKLDVSHLLDGSLLTSNDIFHCLNEHQLKIVSAYCPTNIKVESPLIYKKEFGDGNEVELERVVTVNHVPASFDCGRFESLPHVIKTVTKPVKLTGMLAVHIATDDVNELMSALHALRKELTHVLRNTRISHYQPERWKHISTMSFSLRRFIQATIDHPELVVDESAQHKVNRSRSVHAGVSVLTPIIWMDGWKDITTTFKCRLYDPSGSVIPCHITPPFRLLEFQGKEGDVVSSYDPLIDILLDAVLNDYHILGDDQKRVTIGPGFLLGDHKAMQIMCGTPRGGHYPCPFTTISRNKMPRTPFNCNQRFTLADLAHHHREANNQELVSGMDYERYGRWMMHQNTVTIFEDVGTLSHYGIVPPMMHNSFHLMKAVWCLVPRLQTPAECPPAVSQWKRNLFQLMNVQRTTGCLEQADSRKQIARLANENIGCLPLCVQPLFKLLAQLQSLYYSKRAVTDEDVNLAYVGGMCCHLLTTMLFARSKEGRLGFAGDPHDDTVLNPCSLYFHDIVMVTPAVLKRYRIPLGYLLEETFERDFINNNETLAKGQRKKVLKQIALSKQGQVLTKIVTSNYTVGTKASAVDPIASPITHVKFHRCMFNVQNWIRFRNASLMDKNGNPADIMLNDEDISTWQAGLSATERAFRSHLIVPDNNEVIPIVHSDTVTETRLCICQSEQTNDERYSIRNTGPTGTRRGTRAARNRRDGR